ncbi:ATP-dependent DNA ligase [Georgenia muralis]|uniref:Probable DNA ligase n=1 Tax=Georgenia muralis TaxID=154117 RepID=A0A3N4Z7E1_9MICO|nr:ATP-dependent DNA ligase [Georgenia muralis]RPF27944.1 DNA ligase-1 [Georgenia muralis]
MLLADLVAASQAVAATRSRLAKRHALADALRQAGPEAALVAGYLSGTVRQRRTGLGWHSLETLPAPADAPTLTVAEVDAALESLAALSGSGSQARRTAAVADLFGRATPAEQRFLRLLVLGELRQGALDSLMLDAVAEAASVPLAAVRRAAMFSGETGPVAVAALTGAEAALAAFTLAVGTPVRPMLASAAPDLAGALERLGGEVAVDAKLDGIRIQVHRRGREVVVFTRSLDDITARLPEVVEATRGLGGGDLVLDGEAIALLADGRPRPFQETAARTMSSADVTALREQVPVTTVFFDVLHVAGQDLLDTPAGTRFAALGEVAPGDLVVPRLLTEDPGAAADFYARTLAGGHEGVVVKSLDAPYEAGRRGAAWVKVKPRHTLDLVVLAVEWGSGRRSGTLSNIHLGAADGAGGFVMLGKTFKGMTDEMLAWQTERFLALETHREGHVVHVRPEQVVEIAFDGVQRSPRYPGGVALRFARVLRYREDKPAAEADTLEAVRVLAGL